MAKKNFGKFLALATISTVIAAGITYFLKYRSFHAELDEDFRDFEGDEDSFDRTLPHEGEVPQRNYVPLGEKKEEAHAQEAAEETAGTTGEAMEAEAVKEASPDAAPPKEEASESTATTIVEDLSME